MKIGVIGCGKISGAYLKNGSVFKKQLEYYACADIRMDVAQATAEQYGMKALTVDELLADPEIDAVLNLTTPGSHIEINRRALEAGKHVYCEKPFGLDREGGREIIKLAKEKGLRVGCAPDTFLGGGHQTCRKLIDDGIVGKAISGTAFMMNHGHESWHPAPAFYYEVGGGPLFDMGPYYITALVNMLGPVARVSAMTTRSTDVRQGIKKNINKTFPVEIDTHISAILEFESGAIITLITSFDVWKHSDFKNIEIHGTEGSLSVPDPNGFGGDIKFFKAGLSADWGKADNPFIYNENMRSIGLADMCAAIEGNRPHRASGELAFHVLDIMCSICDAAAQKTSIAVTSTCERPAGLPMGLTNGDLD